MGIIAIDLGGTKVASGLFHATGKVLSKSVAPLSGRKGSEVGRLVCDQVREMIDRAKRKRVRISAVGISVPGIARTSRGGVWAPNIPGWGNYPLRGEVRSAIKKRLPIVIEGDRACYILGEAWRGAARGCQDAIFLSVGTGIAAGIMVNAQVVRGVQGAAGAIGWWALDRPFRGEYTACGCFESRASGEGLVKSARKLLEANESSGSQAGATTWPCSNAITASDIFAARARGDRVAKQVLADAVEFWGMAVANLVSLFNPEKIIFGGGVFGPGLSLLGEIHREAKKWAQPVAIRAVRLEASRLGGDAGLYGAAWLALRAARGKK